MSTPFLCLDKITEEKMKIQLNIQLSKNLREKINEINNFSFNKTANFQFPSDKKGSTREENAFKHIFCRAIR